MLGSPLSDAAFASATASFYTSTRLAAGIEASSVPPASSQSTDSTNTDTQARQTQPASGTQSGSSTQTSSTVVHAVDKVSISTAAKAVAVQQSNPTPQASASSATPTASSISTDADSDLANEAVEPSYTRSVERAEPAGKTVQSGSVQAQHSRPVEASAVSTSTPKPTQSAGKVDTFA